MEFYKVVCYNIKDRLLKVQNGGLIYEYFTAWLRQMGLFYSLVS